jgi:hypothetical protein
MEEFKLIVAGGRDYVNYDHMSRVLFAMSDVEFADKEISIVSGMARGADVLGARFARTNHVKLYKMPANWGKHGNSAGFVRNKQMGDFADGLLAFWDGQSRGTDHMITYMQSLSKLVHIIRY